MELNVGGVTEDFIVSKDLLCSIKPSTLEEMFSGRHELKKFNGKVFIDRNPKIFRYVLDYLRIGHKEFDIFDKT